MNMRYINLVSGFVRSRIHLQQLGSLTPQTSRGSTGVQRRSFSEIQSSLNFEFLKDPRNEEEINYNITARKSPGCIKTLKNLLANYEAASPELKPALWEEVVKAGLKILNVSDPRLVSYGEKPFVSKLVGEKPSGSFLPKEFQVIAKNLDLLRTENLGNLTGQRSYYFIKELAELEQALIHYTVDVLTKKGFILFSVPDLLYSKLIESCGMDTHGERTQVYRMNTKFYDDICLSGTAEMALASFFAGRSLSITDLPKKVAAVSRCYRAETSNVVEERGVYRVHYFTKVEMFGLTRGNLEASNGLLEEFVSIQEELFNQLGIHYQLLDMPLCELGAPAYRKFDIEAWMPGRGIYGEISSASNCTDYQSRRLGIRTAIDQGAEESFVHTVNGTACAVPRMLITLLETHQLANGDVAIPAALQPYFDGRDRLTKTKSPFKLKWIKTKSVQSRIESKR